MKNLLTEVGPFDFGISERLGQLATHIFGSALIVTAAGWQNQISYLSPILIFIQMLLTVGIFRGHTTCFFNLKMYISVMPIPVRYLKHKNIYSHAPLRDLQRLHH